MHTAQGTPGCRTTNSSGKSTTSTQRQMWEEAVTAFREPMDGLKWVGKTLNEQGHLLQSAQALPIQS